MRNRQVGLKFDGLTVIGDGFVVLLQGGIGIAAVEIGRQRSGAMEIAFVKSAMAFSVSPICW